MIGIDDPFVLIAYFGIIASAIASLIYGLVRRNAARDDVTPEDRQWALDEKKVDDDI
ncbi:symporter small accessory protein [Thiorhodococcus fuscus]|uniref:Symporter small accessory protein n=1 Tax=Thiorhodococcus fuscus TaxID=527200 RepID=A0ABW4Y7E2_9GAMM